MSFTKVEMPLVEREEVFEMIDKEIHRVQYAMANKTEDQISIVNIYGNSGYGKSYLKKGYEEKYFGKEIVAFYDFEQSVDAGVDDILYSWAMSMIAANPKYQFDLFSYTYDKYQYIMRNNKKADLKKNLKREKITSAIWEIASGVGGAKGTVEGIVTGIGIEILHDMPEKILEVVRNNFGQHRNFLKEVDNCTQEMQIRELLEIAFIKDMEMNLENAVRPCVFILDTYESYTRDERKMKRYTEEWLKKIISYIDGIVWIIAGREKLEWGGIKFVKHIKVEKIKKEGSFAYIFDDDNIAIDNREHRRYIQKQSEGYPRILGNYVNNYLAMRDKGEIDLKKLNGDIESVVENITSGLNEDAKMLLRILSLLESWPDRQVISEIVGNELHELQRIRQFDVLLKMCVIEENCMERELAKCLRETTPFDEKMNIFHKLLIGQYSEKYQHYIREKAFSLYLEILGSKEFTEADAELSGHIKQFEQELLIQLKYDLEYDLIAFEHRKEIFWDNIEKFSPKMRNAIIIFSRIYLNKCGINVALLAPELEYRLIEQAKQEKDYGIIFELGQIYVELGANEYVEDILEFLQNECNDISYAYCLKTFAFLAAEKYQEGIENYRKYKNEERDETDACYYRIRLEYVKCIRMLGRSKEREAKEILKLYGELSEKGVQGTLMQEVKEFVALAEAVERETRISFAKEDYEKILSLMDDENHTLVKEKKRILARVYKDNAMLKEAIKLYKELLPSDEGKGEIFLFECEDRLNLAYCYKEQGKYKDAKNVLGPGDKILQCIERTNDPFMKSRLMAIYSASYFEITANKYVEKPSEEELKKCYKQLLDAKQYGEEYSKGPTWRLYRVYNYLAVVKRMLRYRNWEEDWKLSKELVTTYCGNASPEYIETVNLFGPSV